MNLNVVVAVLALLHFVVVADKVTPLLFAYRNQ
jgi:hypothetical protein